MESVIGFVIIISLLFWLINTSLKGLNKVLSFVVLAALATRFGMPLLSDRLPQFADFFQSGVEYVQTRILPALQNEDSGTSSSGTSQNAPQRRPSDGTQQQPYASGTDGSFGSSQDRPFDTAQNAPEAVDENAPPIPQGRTAIPYEDDLQNGTSSGTSAQQPVTAWW